MRFLPFKLFCKMAFILSSLCLSMDLYAQNQTAQVIMVSFPTVQVQPDAYKNPDIVSGHSKGVALMGPLDSLIAMSVRGIGAGFDQTKFDSKNTELYPQLKASVSNSFESNIQTNVTSALKSNSFAKGLVSSESTNAVLLNVTEYGLRLQTISETDGAIFNLYLKSNLTVTDSNGKELISRIFNTNSTKIGVLTEFLKNQNFVNEVVNNAQAKLASQVAIELYVTSKK